jgi:predicted phage terminase large subunit-like protein
MVDGICRVEGHRPTGPKETRADIVAGAAQQGRVVLVRGDWNQTLLDELEGFPLDAHDDQVDALAGAFDLLGTRRPMRHSKPQRAPGTQVP